MKDKVPGDRGPKLYSVPVIGYLEVECEDGVTEQWRGFQFEHFDRPHHERFTTIRRLVPVNATALLGSDGLILPLSRSIVRASSWSVRLRAAAQ